MVVPVIWALDEQGQSALLHLVDDVNERVTEGTACINRAFTSEGNLVASTVDRTLSEAAQVWAARTKPLADLTIDRVLAFVVNVSLIKVLEGLPPVDLNIGCATVWQILQLLIDNAIDDTRDDHGLRLEVVI